MSMSQMEFGGSEEERGRERQRQEWQVYQRGVREGLAALQTTMTALLKEQQRTNELLGALLNRAAPLRRG